MERHLVAGRAPEYVLIGAAAFFVFTTLVGVARNYSAVPFWDSWNGNIGFQENASQGLSQFLHALWQPHNEHRIVLTRILFYVNNTLLGGSNLLLIAVNLVLASGIATLLWLFIKRATAPRTVPRWSLTAVAIAAAFSWTQWENFTWEFQSHFFLAPLFAMVSFYLAALWASRRRSDLLLVLGFFAAALSLVSMGAGFPTPALFAALLIALRAGVRRSLFAGLGAVLLMALYFRGLPRGGLGIASLVQPQELSRVLEYLLTFLGSPTYSLTQNLLIAQVAGAIFVMVAMTLTFRAVAAAPKNPWLLGALATVAFVVADGFMAAIARSDLGLQQATGSRYQTPVLIGWVMLTVIVFTSTGKSFRLAAPVRGTALVAIAVLLPAQFLALDGPDRINPRAQFSPAARMVGGLALELAVNDPEQLALLYPDPATLRGLAEFATSTDLAVFGGEYRDLREHLGGEAASMNAEPCQGAVDGIVPVAGDSGWNRVNGWATDPGDGGEPVLVLFQDGRGAVVGFASPGFERPDVAAAVGEAALTAGFHGFVRATVPVEELEVFCMTDRVDR